jgi:hypothetical protein
MPIAMKVDIAGRQSAAIGASETTIALACAAIDRTLVLCCAMAAAMRCGIARFCTKWCCVVTRRARGMIIEEY